MWLKWFPWKYILRNAALRRGFLDPIKFFSQLQNFAQPAEVTAPTELLRSGVILHARGLINSLAIQHNLDWVWPYWVECQFNPKDDAFIPRAFSLTQINLTHRNWTALGLPDCDEFPIVDPRGLITPCYDGWSIDAWIIPAEGKPLIPSRLKDVTQKLILNHGICVETECSFNNLRLKSFAEVIGNKHSLICQVKVSAFAEKGAWLAISLRPYNPEGVSFVNTVSLIDHRKGWLINKKHYVHFDEVPEQYEFSYYHHGDVYSRLPSQEDKQEVACPVGMATAAALYKISPGSTKEITLHVPLSKHETERPFDKNDKANAQLSWDKSLEGVCALQIPNKHFQFLYDAAIRVMVLHSPKEVYPGPFIYRRFWFRDAAFILYALLCVGLKKRVERALDCFRFRQTPQGYFLSQEGEWDSNGEALWINRHFCEMTGATLPKEWEHSMKKAGQWICKKRLSPHVKSVHAGLMPAGFSAEHLGPNDYYYWDDFWSVAGLKAAAFFSNIDSDSDELERYERESENLLACINRSLDKTFQRLGRPAIPASPYRRLDTGAIGSLAASYPLKIFKPDDPRILDTVDFLIKNCLIEGGFFHDMTHSGINPYLTLHIAQVLLRNNDKRYFDLMTAVADFASPTGQWPEAIHPRTRGGCMGDGQHVWAAAEWVLMIRNCFVREEQGRLILCSGIPRQWVEEKGTLLFGPAWTSFGRITISIKAEDQKVIVQWQGEWFGKEPQIDIQLPGYVKTPQSSTDNYLELEKQ